MLVVVDPARIVITKKIKRDILIEDALFEQINKNKAYHFSIRLLIRVDAIK
jgi:hypothetical protein